MAHSMPESFGPSSCRISAHMCRSIQGDTHPLSPRMWSWLRLQQRYRWPVEAWQGARVAVTTKRVIETRYVDPRLHNHPTGRAIHTCASTTAMTRSRRFMASTTAPKHASHPATELKRGPRIFVQIPSGLHYFLFGYIKTSPALPFAATVCPTSTFSHPK